MSCDFTHCEWRLRGQKAEAALRELEAKHDALWMRCQNYRLGGARTGDEWEALQADRDRLREELAWYGEQARLCRVTSSEGAPGRHALQADGGKRARAALRGESE
jgi:hypothetical protein